MFIVDEDIKQAVERRKSLKIKTGREVLKEIVDASLDCGDAYIIPKQDLMRIEDSLNV